MTSFFVERNISEYWKNEVNRIIQNRVDPTVPAVEFDAGETDVDDGRQIEEDQEGQGSNQARLSERQEIKIAANFFLGNYCEKFWTISSFDWSFTLSFL